MVFHWLLFARIFRVYQTLHPFHENTDVPSRLVSHEDTSSPYDSLSPSTSRKGKNTFRYKVIIVSIDGLQSIPRESNDKDVAAMLDELTIGANEESFVIVLQHGGNDVT